MTTYFRNADETCPCTSVTDKCFLKDTVSGLNAFTNMLYLFIGILSLMGLGVVAFFHAKVLSDSSFVYKSRLKLVMLFAYIYFLVVALKSADPLLRFQNFTYILVEDTAIVIVFAQCIYLSIWGKVLQ